VRRIEAITGDGALRRFQETAGTIHRVASAVRGSEENVVEQVERLLSHQRALERELEQLRGKLAQSQIADLDQSARVLKGVKVLAAKVQGLDRSQMRELADSLRNRWKTGVVVLATTEDSKVAIISAVTKDLTSRVHAGKLAGSVAAAVGGRGGGRPDMAEAGGSNAEALPGALENVYTTVEGML
jgi:alanyl-tRNA synthetase